MNNPNRPRPYPRVQEEKTIIDSAHQTARRGSLIGALAGGVAGSLAKKRKLGTAAAAALAGGVAGHYAGRAIGVHEGARDVLAARKALDRRSQLAALRADLVELRERSDAWDFDRSGNAMEPGLSGQHPVPIFPKSKRKDTQQCGIDDEGDYQLTPERQALAEIYGWGIVSALDDSELSEENCQALMEQVQASMSKANGPHSGGDRSANFERQFLASKLGDKAVSEMPDSLVHCHFLSAQRRGLVEFEDQSEATDFALVSRERNDAGQFVDQDQVSSAAVARAYDPRGRRTGRNVGAGIAAGAGLAAALAHFRKVRGSKIARIGNGSAPTLPGADFARGDDSHPVRDTVAGVGAGALGVAGLLALRKRRRLRLAPGVPRLMPGIGDVIDVESTTLAARHMRPSPFSRGPKRFVKRPRRGGKLLPGGKKTNLAFLINDPDFPILPVKNPVYPKGVKVRVKPAKTRAEVIARLKAMTQLSRRDFGAGAGALASSLVEGAVDAVGLGNATAPKKKKLMIDANGNVISPNWLPDPGTTSTSSFASAIARLQNFGIGSALTSGVARDVGVIAGADLTAEEIHDAIQQAQARKRKKARQQVQGGIETTPGMGGAPTTMSAIFETVREFDHGNERLARAKRNGTTAAAAGAGGIAGAIGGLKYDQGTPTLHSDLKPGDRVYRRFGPGGLFQHTGIVGEDGRIVHRTAKSSQYRSVKPDSFAKTGKAPTYRESHPSDLPRAKAAKNATKAAGTRAGRYCVGTNSCQTAVDRLASRGRPSGQLRRAGIGAAVGALGVGSVAQILNRRKDNHGNH